MCVAGGHSLPVDTSREGLEAATAAIQDAVAALRDRMDKSLSDRGF